VVNAWARRNSFSALVLEKRVTKACMVPYRLGMKDAVAVIAGEGTRHLEAASAK
jgi:hypothetical protein